MMEIHRRPTDHIRQYHVTTGFHQSEVSTVRILSMITLKYNVSEVKCHILPLFNSVEFKKQSNLNPIWLFLKIYKENNKVECA